MAEDKPPSENTGWRRNLTIIGIILLLAAFGYVFFRNKSNMSTNPKACVNRTFTVGSKGQCITDAQHMLNWYLYGIDGPRYMKISSLFNAAMQQDLKKIQSNSSLTVSGKLDPPTWKLLCTVQGGPPWWNISAKNAGCF
jgi:hypothetical protein